LVEDLIELDSLPLRQRRRADQAFGVSEKVRATLVGPDESVPLVAFLAPNLVKAAIEGRLPRGIGVERLRDPPTEWSRQFEALGLNPE
jgi:hypothetical protein